MTTAAADTATATVVETPPLLTLALATQLGSIQQPENFHAIIDTYAPPIRLLLALLMSYHVVQPKTLVREEKNKASDYYSQSTQLVVAVQDPAREDISDDLLSALNKHSFSLSGSSTSAIVALGNTPAWFQKAVPHFGPVTFTAEQLAADPKAAEKAAAQLDHHIINNTVYKMDFAALVAKDPTKMFVGLNNADLVEYMALVTRLYELAVAAVVDNGEGALGNNILNMNVRNQETTRLKLEMFLMRILFTYIVK